MPRTKIIEQKSYPFSTTLDVRVGDLNYGAHLGYDRLLGLAHQARMRLFSQMGVSETDLGDGKTGIVAADLAVNYLGEAFVNDDLVFEIRAVEIGPISFRLAHRVVHRESKKKVALAEIGFAGFDYASRSVAVLPEGFREKLGGIS